MKLLHVIKKHKEIFFIFLVSVGFFYKIILHPTQMMYPGGDIRAMYSFWRSFLVESVLHFHKFPLWDPYWFSGMPVIGDAQAGLFYPFTILFFLLPVNLAFGYGFILDFFLLGAFTYLFARTINLTKFSALISAVSMMFSGSIILLTFEGHLFLLDAIVWFPLLLFCYEKTIQTKKFFYTALAAVPLCLGFLAAHIEPAVFGCLAGGIYFILRLWFDWIENKNISQYKYLIFTPFISFTIAIFLAAVEFLPAATLAKLSIRSDGLSYVFASDFFLPPKQLISFLLPHFFGSPVTSTYWGKGNFWTLCGYTGILPLVLTFLALTCKRNKYVLIFSALGIFALLYAFGPATPIFPFFYHHIPGFNEFRAPARFLYVYSFSIAILAGIGVEFLLQKKLSKSILRFLKKIKITLFTIGLGGILFSVLCNLLKNNVQLFEKYILKNSYAVGFNHHIIFQQITFDIFRFGILVILSSLLIMLQIKKTTFVRAGIILVILGDLFFFGIPFYQTKNPQEVFSTPEIVKKIQKDKGIFRVFDLSGKFITPLSHNHIQSITGLNPTRIQAYQDVIFLLGDQRGSPYDVFVDIYTLKNPTLLQLLNVTYVISDKKLTLNGFTEIYHKGYFLYHITNSLPRAYMVPNAKVIKDKDELLQNLVKKDFDPRSLILLENNPNVPLTNKTVFKEVPVTMSDYDTISLSTNLSSPGFLVISEVWYPGWKAYDNGKEIPIYKTDSILRSVSVSKGKHTIIFVFDPLPYTIGFIISTTSLLLLIIYFFYKRSQGERHRH